MGAYNGKITVSKDTMLFVVNSVFNQGIKGSTTKENILKLMPEIYENADDETIIKMLPYRAYQGLEKLIEYNKTNNDIHSFVYSDEHPGLYFLEEAMIVVKKVKHMEYSYTLNPGVIEKMARLFSKENKQIAEIYGNIEELTIGMLYEYGIVDFEFLRKQLCKYTNQIISKKELRDIFFTKLNLNTFVNDYDIRWTNRNEIQEFVTYLNEEDCPIDIGEIAEAQKSRGMKYKQFSKQEILKREEYYCNEKAQKLYKFLKQKNSNIYDWTFKRLAKKNELGLNILSELSNMCMFIDEVELRIFMELYTDWYNNSPQYMLGGYSPIEFGKQYRK